MLEELLHTFWSRESIMSRERDKGKIMHEGDCNVHETEIIARAENVSFVPSGEGVYCMCC